MAPTPAQARAEPFLTVASPRLSAQLRQSLSPLREKPASTGIFTDYDGTIAAIVDDPAEARPRPGAAEVLFELARRYGRVAVVSGRPVAFLRAHLGLPVSLARGHRSDVRLIGLYGMEWASGAGTVQVSPEAEKWREVLDKVAAAAAAAAGADAEAHSGACVEHKGLSVTLHWRASPAAEAWARSFADAWARRSGLVAHPGRRSCELRPPVGGDKGSVVAELAKGLGAACFFGDDAGDLPAFSALDRLAEHEGLLVRKVAVASAEVPTELVAAADAIVDGPDGVLAALRWLATADEERARG